MRSRDRTARPRAVPIVAATLAATVALGVLGCATVNRLTEARRPQLSVQDVRFTDLSFDAVELTFDVGVTNPNPVGATLAGFDYDFKLDETSVVSGRSDEGFTLEPLGSSTLPIPVRLDYADLYATVEGLASRDVSTYQMSTGVTFDVPVLGRVRVPLSKTGELPLVKVPSISAGRLEVGAIGVAGATLSLGLDIVNPNAFDLQLRKLDYQLVVAGSPWISTVATPAREIKAASTGTLVLPVRISFSEVGATVARLLTGEAPLDYHLTGSMDLATSNELLPQALVPFDRLGTVPVVR